MVTENRYNPSNSKDMHPYLVVRVELFYKQGNGQVNLPAMLLSFEETNPTLSEASFAVAEFS
jgi:hypothetical protein